MEKIKELLSIEEDNVSNKMLILLLVLSVLFGVVVRYYWIYLFGDNPEYYWNNQLMINTNDGYAWAEGARDILNGGNTPNDQSAMAQPVAQITAILVQILPFSFETIILWMPAVFGSFLSIPILLIGRSFNHTWLGFFAGCFASIAWSYYNRTMMGYYDTDLLVIVLPTFVLYSLILALTHNRDRYLLLTTFMVVAYQWYYGGSYSLNLATVIMLFLYTIVFERKNIYNYKLMSFFLIAIIFPYIWLKIFVAVMFYLALKFKKDLIEKNIFYILGALFLYLLIFGGGFNAIFRQLENYVFRKAVADEIALQFFNVVQTVREAGAIPFDVFANRISGHTSTFIISVIGTILLMLRHPIMLLSIPMIGLGFLALNSGLRFTVYAIPPISLGLMYIIFLVTKKISIQKIKHGTITALFIVALIPNILHIIEYKVPVVFSKSEVTLLDNLGKISQPEDYVITWWDYGFPIRYYSDVKTLVDGGAHDGSQNFAPSFIMTSMSQRASANYARMEVEYLEKIYKEKLTGLPIIHMIKDYGFKDSKELIKSMLSDDFVPPAKTRDIFLYLPFRMFNIFPTVALFSNLDLETGQQFQPSFFQFGQGLRETQNEIIMPNGIAIVKDQGMIRAGQQMVPMKSFFLVEFDNTGKIKTQQQNLRPNGINAIFLKNYNAMLLVDDFMLNSTFVQLFIFENYDKNLFEPVQLTPFAKVYKLKN